MAVDRYADDFRFRGPIECERVVTSQVSCSVFLCAFSHYRHKIHEGTTNRCRMKAA